MVFDNYIFMVMNTPFFQSFKQHFFCFVQQQQKELSKIYIIYFTIKLPLEIWVMIGLQYYLVVEEGETAKNQGHVLQQVWPEKEPSLMKDHQLFA